MNQIAFIFDNVTLYWYSIILAMAVLSGICFFLACCHHRKIHPSWAAVTVLLSVILSLVFARLMYWYSRADSYATLTQALTTQGASSLALSGAFFGCIASALLLKRCAGGALRLLDCMSVGGCWAIALGRLADFFASADRGQILTEMTALPWAYPVLNATSGLPEYRLATFVLQAIVAAVLFVILAWLMFSPRHKDLPKGDITLVFLLVYTASQVILDSTRYDSLYLRSNGFISVVQLLSAITLGLCIIFISLRAAKSQGVKKWMIALWIAITALFGLAGYMEYYVQRHGRLAFFSYSIMEHCLVGIVVLSVILWRYSLKKKDPEFSIQ